MRRAPLFLTGIVLAAAASACTFNPPAPGTTGSGTGTGGNHGLPTGSGGSTGSTGSGLRGGSTGTGTSGGGGDIGSGDAANCGQLTTDTQNLPPDLLLIFDKSGSMADQFDGTTCNNVPNCMTKWTPITTAISDVVTQTDATIRWGVKFYPSNTQCGVNNGVDVPVGANTGMMITNAIGMRTPGGRTPTRLAINNGAAYLRGLTDPNPKYMLLATDGLPNCLNGSTGNNADDPDGAVMAVADAAAAGIPTFVVGVGSVAGAEATLTRMAQAGGRPADKAPFYYPVASGQELVTVLNNIGTQIASCNFTLNRVPPVPDNIAVLGDSKAIPKSTTDGWQYGPGMMSVELVGSYCDRVQNKDIGNVQVIFGCPNQVIVVP